MSWGPVEFKLVITGIGVVNTAHALTKALEKKKTKLVIQTGIAGAFKDAGLETGDVAVSTSERYLHTGIQSGSIEPLPLPFDLIESCPDTRHGLFNVDASYSRAAFDCLASDPACSTFVHHGPFITVSRLTGSMKWAQGLFHAFSPLMESMEGSAAAHVSQLYNIPFIQVRAASNLAGDRDKNNWNLPLAFDRIREVMQLLLTRFDNIKLQR